MSFKKSSELEIVAVKFYQGVNISQRSNITSVNTNKERTATDQIVRSIERGEFSIMVTETNYSGVTSYTEIPYNNVAYINYEKVGAAAPEAPKASKAK